MKTQKVITDFKCDECKKEIENCTDFPYDKNWTYLYSFSFKLAKNWMNPIKDKHFCSKACLIKFINAALERSYTV